MTDLLERTKNAIADRLKELESGREREAHASEAGLS